MSRSLISRLKKSERLRNQNFRDCQGSHNLYFEKKYCFAEIAQLVEQRIRNAWVVGSNPILGSIFK